MLGINGVAAEDLFQRQVAKLQELRYYEAAGMSQDDFLHTMTWLGDRIRGLRSDPRADIPFILAGKDWLVSYPKKLSWIQSGGKKGTWYDDFSFASLKDASNIKFPGFDYYFVEGIDLGLSRVGLAPRKVVKQLDEQYRNKGCLAPTGLTVNEGMMLAIYFPQLIEGHHLDLVGSRCSGSWCDEGHHEFAPHLRKRHGRPTIGYHDLRWPLLRCGTPTCRIRWA